MNQSLIAALFVLLTFASRAGEAPRLLPFQARLTDATGKPVADGTALVQFQFFGQPIGASPLWAGEVHRLTVNNGLVNVTLGSKNPFPLNQTNAAGAVLPFFDTTLYLEVTVDSAGNPDGSPDSLITASDPPLLPRQIILPTIFAKEAADSRKLAGYAVDQLPNNIPVGGVIMWWGSLKALPAGFEVCDGAEPATPGATLQGLKPDLRDRFPKAPGSSITDVKANPVSGGTNTIPQRLSGGTTLTIAQMPSHAHSTARDYLNPVTQGAGPWSGGGMPGGTGTANGTGTTGGNQPHDHTIPAHDNRPAFLELFFIIRVK